jgi:phosphatidylserine/phosphatidylglycerophosphate/cardiolipin synthase-like enzyme
MRGRSESRPILREGKTCWRRSPSRRVSFLVDGKAYFAAVAAALEKAQRRITIIGWDFNSAICLQPESAQRLTLAEILHRLVAARPELHVYILIWRGSVFYGDNPELFQLLFSGKWAHPRIHFKLDDAHPVASCHHQKIVTVDDAIAFCGGIDLTTRRWDDDSHTLCHALREADGEKYPPVHDVQVMVDGAAARDVCELTRQRWFNATGERIDPVVGEFDPWPDHVEAHVNDHPVGVARTQPRYRRARRAREIKAMIPAAVARAQDAVYIETQYFALPVVAKRLARHLRRPDGPEVIIVATRRSKGALEQFAMAAPRDRLFQRLRRADRYGRLGLFFAVAEGDPESEINIHSKITIVDDRFLRIGSANLNRRSMGVDTECDIAIEAEHGGARESIVSLRNALIAEHLCADVEAFEAAVEEHGSLLAAIEKLNGNSRCLVPYEKPAKASVIFGRDLFDPARPLSLVGLWSRFISAWMRPRPG